MNDEPFTALLDTCSFRNAPTSEIVLESLDGSVPSLSGPKNSLVRMATRRMPRIPENEFWKQAQSNAMASIAQLARDGNVRLLTYNEIEIEILYGTYFPSSLESDCLAGVKIDSVPAAIERSKFQKMSFEAFTERSTRIAFCCWLLSLDPREVAKRPQFISMLSDFERRNLETLDRFKELCANLNKKHYFDAFHLWTAEVNNLAFFLTADKTFINAMTNTSRVTLPTRPIFPSDFLRIVLDGETAVQTR
jgi:hypothetical protein